MNYQIALTKEIYRAASIDEALDDFAELCQCQYREEANAFLLTIQNADEQTKDELLNYILEGSI